MLGRRAFLAGIASLVATPRTGETQQAGKVYRIGVLSNSPVRQLAEVFYQMLGERGWVEGQNIVVERRYAEGRFDRFPSLAAELVSLKPDLILASTAPGVRAAKQ